MKIKVQYFKHGSVHCTANPYVGYEDLYYTKSYKDEESHYLTKIFFWEGTIPRPKNIIQRIEV